MASASPPAPLGWLGIVRLGLVQTSLGAIVVLTTSTLNRIMVVELALPAMVPGALVALHYAVQILRPRWGYGSDIGGRRTPWIIGGMAILAGGGLAAAIATALMATRPLTGFLLATIAFLLIGIGVGASGTSLLALLAQRVEDRRRGPAASIVWMMMIAGFVLTATSVGHALDPFSFPRLIGLTALVGAVAVALTAVALWGIEGAPAHAASHAERPTDFRSALREVWADAQARRFTIFVFVSMLAYSAQDLILEPYAGTVFGYTPGESTRLGGLQHAGVLIGMIVVAAAGVVGRAGRQDLLRVWVVGGCLASGVALIGLAAAGTVAFGSALTPWVVILGIANGAFAVAAIGTMMALAGQGGGRDSGTRMGLWGAAQGIAFGLGGFAGTLAVDLARVLLPSPATAYATVFLAEALLFVASAALALRIAYPAGARDLPRLTAEKGGVTP